MLIINEELLAIDQAIEYLVSYFLKLPEVENYRLKRQKFENDRELQEQLFAFQELKDSYDTAKRMRLLDRCERVETSGFANEASN